MDRLPCTKSAGAILFLTLLQIGAAVPASGADAAAPSRMNCGAQIECLTPDGQLGRISKLPAQDPTATALIMEDDTVTCVLQEGETNFVIELPAVAVPDRFTFLNENGKARGELKISVSNHRLAPDSPQWKEVEGVIPFAHKRLFGVSLLGIEAKYVRLSFRVDKQGPIASSAVIEKTSAEQNIRASAVASVSFSSSALDEALNSTFKRESRSNPVLLGCIISSVAPLRLNSN